MASYLSWLIGHGPFPLMISGNVPLASNVAFVKETATTPTIVLVTFFATNEISVKPSPLDALGQPEVEPTIAMTSVPMNLVTFASLEMMDLPPRFSRFQNAKETVILIAIVLEVLNVSTVMALRLSQVVVEVV